MTEPEEEQIIQPDEARLLVVAVMYSAIHDYFYSESSGHGETAEGKMQIKEDARAFLFDDDFTLDWGDKIITSTLLLDYVDMDIEWLRIRVREREKKPFNRKTRLPLL